MRYKLISCILTLALVIGTVCVPGSPARAASKTIHAVAIVSKTGVVRAKKNGKCTVYAYAQNGIYKKLTVTVK